MVPGVYAAKHSSLFNKAYSKKARAFLPGTSIHVNLTFEIEISASPASSLAPDLIHKYKTNALAYVMRASVTMKTIKTLHLTQQRSGKIS